MKVNPFGALDSSKYFRREWNDLALMKFLDRILECADCSAISFIFRKRPGTSMNWVTGFELPF